VVLLAVLTACSSSTGKGSVTGAAGGDAGTGGSAGGGGAPVDAAGTGGATGKAPMEGSPCESEADCSAAMPTFLLCQAPGEFLGCGLCQPAQDSCASDADCATGAAAAPGMRVICETAPQGTCFCQPTKVCEPGCRTDDDCLAGQACNVEHRCQATCASGGVTCPVDFGCGSDGFCYRLVCTTDAACSVACVKGVCYDRPGTCTTPPL